MKKNFFCLLLAWVCAITSLSALDISRLPRQISSGPQGKHHIQGIAYDEKNDCIGPLCGYAVRHYVRMYCSGRAGWHF